MDRNTLIAELVKASVEMFKASTDLVKGLAWPAVVGFVIWFFKDKWLALFDNVSELELFGQKAKFARKVEEVQAEVREIAVEEQQPLPPFEVPPAPHYDERPPPMPSNNAEENTQYDDRPVTNMLLLYADPSAGFHLGRQYLERTLTNMFTKMTGTVPGLLVMMDDVIVKLEQQRYINAKMRRTIKDLLDLANQVAHSKYKPNVETAKLYVNSVQSITDLMKDRAKRMP
ncbi:hypothetical protein ACSFA8_09275 [Variovorax sp. RT4R15]|uniref:hypothetical protein n=1 Tax=Variovorax sp. RT4R15 TaxID=3443737 RepID=UPI003F45ECDE